jgi:pilus assembly protein CpaB
MSRNAAALNPGRGNRRFILLAIVLGLMGAGLVYVATSRNTTSNGGGGGSAAADTPVLVAKVDIPARTTVTADMVEVRLVGADSRSVLAYDSVEGIRGKVTRFPIAANEQVLSSKVVDLSGGSSATARSLSYIVPEGKRAFAIGTSEVRDVGGLLLPGDYIDVMVKYDVAFGDETKSGYLAHILLQNVEVLAISQAIVDVVPGQEPTETGQRERISEARPNPGAGTITLALTAEDAQLIFLAESHGEIRFALRPYGDSEERPVDFTTERELLPPNIPAPIKR